MAKLSLDPYNMELMKRGIGGAPMTRKEAVIESGKGVDPSSVADNPITYMDDLKRFGINLQNILKAGGLSQANLPATSQGIEAAVKKVTEAGGVKEGKTPDDFVPFDPTTLPNVKIFESTPGSEGPKLVQDLSPPGLGSKSFVDAKENLKKQNQEDFRKTEAALVEMQGGLKSQPVVGQGQDNNPNAAGVEESDPTVRAFMAGMDEFINAARGAAPNVPPVQDIEDYKKVFAEATGLDISGKPDKSSALMSLGLALMQNRAGSGFNVGNILRAVGQAGEVALPKLEAAKKEAKANAAAAGKFALEMRSADQAKATAAQEKAMEREDYFIVPNQGGGLSGDIAGILSNEGRLEKLSKYELNRLMNDKEFSSKFTILPGATYATVVEEALKTPDAVESWDDKVVTRNLIPEIDDPLFQIDLSYGKPGGSKEGQYVIRDAEQLAVAEDALRRMMQDNNRAREQFIELGLLTSDNRNFFTYSVDKLNSLASAFGVTIGEKETETDTIIRVLEKIAMKNAPEILGESGKTISDGDRERVERIVGQLKATGDIRTVRARIQELFNDIIIGTEKDIIQGLTNLSRYTKKDYGLGGSQNLNEEEAKELAGYEGT